MNDFREIGKSSPVEVIADDMKRVYMHISNTGLTLSKLLKSRQDDLITCRHICRVFMKDKHSATLKQIARAEQIAGALEGQPDHSKINNSIKQYRNWIISDRPVLLSLMWNLVYNTEHERRKAINRVRRRAASLAEVD